MVLLESGILLLVPWGGYLLVRGFVSAGVLLLFACVGTQYLTDIRPLQELGSNLSYVLNGVTQVKEILETPVFGGGKPFPKRHDIELRDVSFAYGPDSRDVLEHVNLHIAQGEQVAFAGESGAGKTTLVQLISCFYDVTSGSVQIAGVVAEGLLEGCNFLVLFQVLHLIFNQTIGFFDVLRATGMLAVLFVLRLFLYMAAYTGSQIGGSASPSAIN